MRSRHYPPVEVGVGENLGVRQGSVTVCEREGAAGCWCRTAGHVWPCPQPCLCLPPPRHPQTSCWHLHRCSPRRRLPGSLPSPSRGDLFGSPWWQVAVGPIKSRARRWAGSPELGHVLFQRPCSPLRRSAPAQPRLSRIQGLSGVN